MQRIENNPVFDFLSEKFPAKKISWREYIDCALYHPDFGYYASKRVRVSSDGGDFYTAASMRNNVFGELLHEAIKNILHANSKNLDDYTICELGAEPDSSIIPNSLVLRLRDEKLIPKNCILISNELLDARPFARFRFMDGDWEEAFLSIEKNDSAYLVEEVFEQAKAEEKNLLDKYFEDAKLEGFRIDLSFDAIRLLENLCEQNWKGMLLFFDYFRSAKQISNFPEGTARTYRMHNSSANLLEEPSQSDITYSPCYEIFCDTLESANFKSISFASQEKFFLSHSANLIRKIIENTNALDPRKRELVELINPSHMGQNFGAICALRF